jgi:hypothetical protein
MPTWYDDSLTNANVNAGRAATVQVTAPNTDCPVVSVTFNWNVPVPTADGVPDKVTVDTPAKLEKFAPVGHTPVGLNVYGPIPPVTPNVTLNGFASVALKVVGDIADNNGGTTTVYVLDAVYNSASVAVTVNV